MSDEMEDVEAFGNVLTDVTGPAYLVNPSQELLRVAVAAARRDETAPELRVLGPGKQLRSFRNTFRVASRTAELVQSGRLTFRSHESESGTTLLTTSDAVYVPLAVRDTRSVVPVADPEFQTESYEWSRDRWSDAEPFGLHTPPLAAVRETLAAEFGDPMCASFDEALATVDRGDENAFDPVMAVVVAGARHGCQHYDLSRWGEAIGFASKATFSRKKNKLERLGVVETEKVSVERGRPRQRLVLTDEYETQVAEDGLEPVVANVAY